MENIFTLPYSEYKVAEELQNVFPKNKGFALLVPMSRQQKGFDLLIYSNKSKKSATIQVKASRSWDHIPTGKHKYDTNFWFGNIKHVVGRADFYILFGVYEEYSKRKTLNKSRKPDKWIHNRMIVFTDKEMGKFINSLKTKKGKKESQFYFSFNKIKPKEIFLTRGSEKKTPVPFEKHILENKLYLIFKFLK